ncbi:hypothetical protein MWU59_08815 [Flavobacteriaceae bacterium F08102]|nr:hypothetical protein [Flavobacteriaceae bacterium F08102]
MYNFRNRPNDNYIHEANWPSLYVLTEHWKSDLLFFNDDLKFMHHLIDKYFLWLSKKENIDQVQEIEVHLLQVDAQCDTLLKKVQKHLEHLAELIDDPFKYDSHQFREDHVQLENDLAQFVKDYRKNRAEIFAITEHIMDSETLVRRLKIIPKKPQGIK